MKILKIIKTGTKPKLVPLPSFHFPFGMDWNYNDWSEISEIFKYSKISMEKSRGKCFCPMVNLNKMPIFGRSNFFA